MDGHTKEGSYEVTLVLTKDMVDQLTRLLNLAKMMDGRDFTPKHPDAFDIYAYREFLGEILQILDKAIKDQPRPK